MNISCMYPKYLRINKKKLDTGKKNGGIREKVPWI